MPFILFLLVKKALIGLSAHTDRFVCGLNGSYFNIKEQLHHLYSIPSLSKHLHTKTQLDPRLLLLTALPRLLRS